MNQFDELDRILAASCPTLELRKDEVMAKHTSFHIGGPVKRMALPKTEAEAIAAVQAAQTLGLRPRFLGNGSNLLVSDAGVEALLIASVPGLGETSCNDCGITASSGVTLARLAHFALAQGLTGLEFAHGIPGSLGGAVTMNAGAYNGEIADVVKEVRLTDKMGQTVTCAGDALDFSYRHSAFSDETRLILGATLQLKKGNPETIRARMEELAAWRRAKQPLEYPSGGSTFKRPTGHFAAVLIDEAQLRGTRVGGAQVSEKHAGFIVNTGGATCDDVLKLVDLVREAVWKRTGICLELEVKTLGIEV